MNSIKTLIAENATVIRDGEQQTIPAKEVVVGDIVLLSMGDRVPADVRLVKASSDLRFDRSLLTGERYVSGPPHTQPLFHIASQRHDPGHARHDFAKCT